MYQNQVWILDVYRKRLKFPELQRNCIRLAQDHSANVLLVEDAASGTQLLQTLYTGAPQGVPRPIARKTDADKITRLSGVTSMIEAGQLFLPKEAGWLAEFQNELLGFPFAKYDDQVDALSQLLIWVRDRQRLPARPGVPILHLPDEP